MARGIRAAGLADLPALSDLCLSSKAHWGYDADFMDACRDELTLCPADLARARVVLLEEGDLPIGVAQLTLQGDAAELQKLFILPLAIGQGAGRALLDWAIRTARGSGAARLECDADPFAEGFYLRAGFRRAGIVPSATWPGRMLPRMALVL